MSWSYGTPQNGSNAPKGNFVSASFTAQVAPFPEDPLYRTSSHVMATGDVFGGEACFSRRSTTIGTKGKMAVVTTVNAVGRSGESPSQVEKDLMFVGVAQTGYRERDVPRQSASGYSDITVETIGVYNLQNTSTQNWQPGDLLVPCLDTNRVLSERKVIPLVPSGSIKNQFLSEFIPCLREEENVNEVVDSKYQKIAKAMLTIYLKGRMDEKNQNAYSGGFGDFEIEDYAKDFGLFDNRIKSGGVDVISELLFQGEGNNDFTDKSLQKMRTNSLDSIMEAARFFEGFDNSRTIGTCWGFAQPGEYARVYINAQK